MIKRWNVFIFGLIAAALVIMLLWSNPDTQPAAVLFAVFILFRILPAGRGCCLTETIGLLVVGVVMVLLVIAFPQFARFVEWLIP